METHEKKAMEMFNNGYNCCQSVLIPYCKELGMDEKTAVTLSSSFGGGIGGLGETCGAVCGMFMVLGLKYANFDPCDKDAKNNHKKFLRTYAKKFTQDNGSIICRELVKDVTYQDKLKHCGKYIEYAVRLLNENSK